MLSNRLSCAIIWKYINIDHAIRTKEFQWKCCTTKLEMSLTLNSFNEREHCIKNLITTEKKQQILQFTWSVFMYLYIFWHIVIIIIIIIIIIMEYLHRIRILQFSDYSLLSAHVLFWVFSWQTFWQKLYIFCLTFAEQEVIWFSYCWRIDSSPLETCCICNTIQL